MIKVKSARILLTNKSNILMSDFNSDKNQHSCSKSKVFIFAEPRFFELKGISKVGEDSIQFRMMLEHIESENKDLINSKQRFIAIFNGRFESISIMNGYKRWYPNPDRCNIVKFTFTSELMSSNSKIIRNYLSFINERTKIKLYIGRNAYNWIKTLMNDFLELKNLGNF